MKEMGTEVSILCDVEKRTSNWLKEIFNNSLNSLNPTTLKSTLILSDSHTKSIEYMANKLKKDFGENTFKKISLGVGGFIKPTGSFEEAEKAAERKFITPWKGIVMYDPYFQLGLSVSIPALREVNLSHERVTASFAHEIAEYRVVTEMK